MDAIQKVLIQSAQAGRVSDATLEEALYDLCDRLHACDCEECPVVAACTAASGKLHKDGAAMLKAVRAL